MEIVRVPLLGKTLRSTGDDLLRAGLLLAIRTLQGKWKETNFRVDPGTEMSTMPAAGTKANRIAMPRLPTPGLAMNIPGGLGRGEVRPGFIRARILVWGKEEFYF